MVGSINPVPVDVAVTAVSASRLQFIISTSHPTMVAIGFPTTSNLMPNTDTVIGWASGGVIDDYKIGTMRTDCATSSDGVCKDAINNLIDASITSKNGFTIMTFTRERNTGDTIGDTVLAEPDEEQNIHLALGPDNFVSWHNDKKASAKIRIPKFANQPATTQTCAYVLNDNPWWIEVSAPQGEDVLLECNSGRRIQCRPWYDKFTCESGDGDCPSPRNTIVDGQCCSLGRGCGTVHGVQNLASSEIAISSQTPTQYTGLIVGVVAAVIVGIVVIVVAVVVIYRKQATSREQI